MSLSKQDKKELIRKVSKSSGIAQYAIEAKISDAHLIELSQHLDILQLLKKSNDYNRYCQRQKTAEANAKLKEFMNPENSEIVKVGKWLLDALSKNGEIRKLHLLEKDLVHKEDYNETLEDLKEVIKEQQKGLEEQAKIAQEKIYLLERRNDNLRKQLRNIEIYITNNLGLNKWNEIRQYIFR
jgi:DNA mismatch repair ATPase MutS